ncbi:hypothetical protein EDF60_2077 [Leucobacter luti]|nr:hypothetical protein EDF60_2077 [Leucobacter luti]
MGENTPYLCVDGDEVNQVLDTADELRLKVAKIAHAAADPRPRIGDVGRLVARPPEGQADAFLPLDAARNRWPGLKANTARLDGLPDIDEWVADDENVCSVRSACNGIRDP